MTKIIFRCDSSLNIGSGHLIRCLNLANKLNADIIFICRNLQGNINSKVLQNQFRLIELKPLNDYQIEEHMEEIDEILPYFQRLRPDVIIVDHYGLNFSWEEEAKKHCKKLIAIDDLNRPHSAHAILDQNYYITKPSNYQSKHSYIGPQFCFLNPSFEVAPKCNISPKISNILVFFGGSDIFSLTLKIANLAPCFGNGYQWHFVLGNQNQDIDKIKNIANSNSNINLHIDINYMATLMSESDIFIGAGGTTSWERAKLGLPSLVISVAKNQEEICRNLHQANIISYLGPHERLKDEFIIQAIKDFSQNYDLRIKLSKNSLKLKVSEKLENLIDYINSDT